MIIQIKKEFTFEFYSRAAVTAELYTRFSVCRPWLSAGSVVYNIV